MLAKQVKFFDNILILACDGKCNKAWGINSRPLNQLSDDDGDFEWLNDNELGDAPDDPQTYEGQHGKPQAWHERLNKWCARECERSIMARPNEAFELKDFSQRIPNLHKRMTPAPANEGD